MAKSKQVRKRIQKPNTPKKCYFCDEKKEPIFSDTAVLQRFTTERGKIIARSRNGLCAKHQRTLTVEVKKARYLALLPFVVKV
ncbi:MAG: 30S ribosomal protein S18 [Patescibacteria group bacterium]|nr:30S ribosomal protein S18 [Patescibacteria group bacterium]